MTGRQEKVALALRALAHEGFFALPFGHMSVRADDGAEPILILRHLHEENIAMEQIAAGDIIGIAADGTIPAGLDAPGERFIHTAVYAQRPDVSCVLHYHSRLTAAFGRAGRTLVPQTPLGAILGGIVGVHDYGGQIDSPEKGAALADALADGAAITLPAHGAVVVGGSVEEVAARALALEDCCAIELAAAQLGAAPAPPPADASPHTAVEVNQVLWDHLLRRHGLDA